MTFGGRGSEAGRGLPSAARPPWGDKAIRPVKAGGVEGFSLRMASSFAHCLIKDRLVPFSSIDLTFLLFILFEFGYGDFTQALYSTG